MRAVIWSSFHSSRWTSGSWCHRAPSPTCHVLTAGTRLPRFPNLPSVAAPKAASTLSLDLDKDGKYLPAWQALLCCGSALAAALKPSTPKCRVFAQILSRKDISDLIARYFWLTETLTAVFGVTDTGISLSSNYALPLWLCFPLTLLWSSPNCLGRAARGAPGASGAELKQTLSESPGSAMPRCAGC